MEKISKKYIVFLNGNAAYHFIFYIRKGYLIGTNWSYVTGRCHGSYIEKLRYIKKEYLKHLRDFK